MRTLWTIFVVVLTTCVLGTVVMVAALFRVRDKPGGIYYWCMHTWARLDVWAAGARVELHNPERMSSSEGVVYIANHVSWFDVLALASVLPRYSFVAKSELRKIPVFGPACSAAGIVFLDRENRKQAFESYKGAADQVRDGKSIVVYPEGTRGRDYPLRPFKKGPFVLAIAAQAPIVPTIIYGAREVMPRGSFRVRRGVIHVHFLEPVPTAGMQYDQRGEVMTLVWRRMADALHESHGVPVADRPIAKLNERII